MRRIGIFGGTFDPPHIGHLILAEELSHSLSMDVVYWVLTPQPPHKPDQKITPIAHRKQMLNSFLKLDPNFEFSNVDLDRSPPHYAADTVKIFRDQFPKDELIYLIGEDSLRDLPRWERPDRFLETIDILGVLSRPRVTSDLGALDRELEGINEKAFLVSKPLLQISSSDIRLRIREGRPFRYFLHPSVYALIEENGLYRERR